MSQVLYFNDIPLSPVTHQNSLWIRAAELARALGYSREDKVSRIYERNSEEFTHDMTQLVEIVETPEMGLPKNLITKARIFSLRGCHLIAMFARTPVAKQFRRWVLDVLDKLAEEERQAVTGCHQLPITPSTVSDRKPLRSLVNAWARVSGQHHDALWPQVKAHFQLERIDDLPVAWLPDALAFVQAKIDGMQKAIPAAPQVPALRPARHVPGPVEAELDQLHGELVRLSIHATEFRETLARIRKVTLPVYHETYTRLGWHERCGVGVDYIAEVLSSSYYRSLEHMRDAHDEAKRHLATFRVLARLQEM